VYGLVAANLTFREPFIVIYSYNESQRDALFLIFIDVEYIYGFVMLGGL